MLWAWVITGIVERYLGIEIEQDPNDKSIILHQSAYIQQLLKKIRNGKLLSKSHTHASKPQIRPH